MTKAPENDLLALVDRFFTAYNDMDLDTFASLLTDDIHWEHHNRFLGKGAEPLVQSIRDIHAKLPNRRFGEVTRWSATDDTIYTEHDWTATPVESDPSWGWEAGIETSMDCVSVFVFEGGRIKEWSDYG